MPELIDSLDNRYRYKLNSMPRGSNFTKPIQHTCNRPLKTASIDTNLNCLLCICGGWIPIPVGKITDFNNLEDIWNNDISKVIQNDVDDKKFTWCAIEHCGITTQSFFENSYQLIFGIDDSCNLHCPSCRRQKILHSAGKIFEEKSFAVEHTVNLINCFTKPIHITLSSTGDPLASKIYRPFLHSYHGKDTQSFTLFTNGLLIKKHLHKSTLLKRITKFWISVDAGSKEVYEKVRLGGRWETLISNFDFLQKNGLAKSVSLLFVVQKNNYKDIPNFINLLDKYGFNGSLTPLDDWGTWNYNKVEFPDRWTLQHGTFLDHDVSNKSHKMFYDCQNILSGVKNKMFFAPRLRSLFGV